MLIVPTAGVYIVEEIGTRFEIQINSAAHDE